MQSSQKRPYRDQFTLTYRAGLAVRISPLFLFHWLRRPYRDNVASIGFRRSRTSLKRRSGDAAFDAVFNILLQGYTELTGRDVTSATGQMFFFLRELYRAFDEEFERRSKIGGNAEFREILNTPCPRQTLDFFKRYLDLFGRKEDVISYLLDAFERHYGRYRRLMRLPSGVMPFTGALQAAELDSGMQLSCLLYTSPSPRDS